jgi:4-alpha-glucanotransferase
MYDGTEQDLLRLLASRAGISPEYYDIAGTLHNTSDGTTRAILSAMGFCVDSRESLTQELSRWDEAVWQQPCDPILIVQQGYQEAQWSLRLLLESGDEQDLTVTWHIADEKGAVIHRAEAGPRLIAQEER